MYLSAERICHMQRMPAHALRQQPTYLVVFDAAVIRCRILSFAESFVPVFSAGTSLDGWSQVST